MLFKSMDNDHDELKMPFFLESIESYVYIQTLNCHADVYSCINPFHLLLGRITILLSIKQGPFVK